MNPNLQSIIKGLLIVLDFYFLMSLGYAKDFPPMPSLPLSMTMSLL